MGFGINPVLLELAVTVSVCVSLVAPVEMPERFTDCALASSLIVTLASALSVGAWLALNGTVVVVSFEKSPSKPEPSIEDAAK